MWTITLPWATWRTLIDVRRTTALPPMLNHADRLEQLEQHSPIRPR